MNARQLKPKPPRLLKNPEDAVQPVLRFERKYSEEIVQLAEEIAFLGATDREIAAIIRVNVETLKEWKKIHPEFAQRLDEAKLRADMNVANRLYRRATGYTYKAEKIITLTERDPDGTTTQRIVHEPYDEQVAPDTNAAIFWLVNRRPDLWRGLNRADREGVKETERQPQMATDAETEELLAELKQIRRRKLEATKTIEHESSTVGPSTRAVH